MVRAIRDGRKAQTRRIVNNLLDAPAFDNVHPTRAPKHPAPYLDAYCDEPTSETNPRGAGAYWCWWTRDDRSGPLFKPCLWKPGDYLWVRESFSGSRSVIDLPPGQWPHETPIWYWADGSPEHDTFVKRRPAIHMPRWMSRITLLVEAVRMERVQDISEADAVAEGAFKGKATGPEWRNARDWYADLWDTINGPGEWDANPWVSVTTFRQLGTTND
jgi:hypothetical protein